MFQRPSAVIAIPAAAAMLAACSGGPFSPAPLPDDIRSAPAASYPDINRMPERAGRARTPDEVERIQAELESLREAHRRRI